MSGACHNFPKSAAEALQDARLQEQLGRTMRDGFQAKRTKAKARLAEFDALRDRASEIRAHVLDHLGHYLAEFEKNVMANGGQVHWAETPQEARRIITDICREAGAKTVTKGKSMITEEIGLNAHLSAQGIQPIETDLGEYIIQLRGETPSHIIAPALHVSKAQVADAFKATHTDLDPARDLQNPTTLLGEARAKLRAHFLNADVGITGANMLVAETGTALIVTNEGNGDLTQSLPPVHIAVASLEKVVPTLEDAAQVLRVLARSATGQDSSVYTTFFTGAKRADEPDGPDAFHVVILDNRRTDLLKSQFRDVLKCIRCGACMNHCPVYGVTGGHAYGGVYPGPIGSVLGPHLDGLDKACHLPFASTLCGRCSEVCSVNIPLADLLRQWRVEAKPKGLTKWGLNVWRWLALRPGVYRLTSKVGAAVLRRWASRPFPKAQGGTFFDRYKGGER